MRWLTMFLFPLCDGGDPLPAVGDPAPTPAPPRSSKPVCEYCECVLTPSGEVFKMSDRAKQLRRQGETIEEKDRRIAELERELGELKTKYAELSGGARSRFDLTLS